MTENGIVQNMYANSLGHTYHSPIHSHPSIEPIPYSFTIYEDVDFSYSHNSPPFLKAMCSISRRITLILFGLYGTWHAKRTDTFVKLCILCQY